MESRYLNLEEAYSICRAVHSTGECDDYLDLSAYSQADPDALTLFATGGYWSGVFLGLTSLSVDNAAVLADWGVIVDFSNLSKLTREAAALFREGMLLSIDGLHELEVDVATELANGPYSFSIAGLRSLSMEAANALAKHQGCYLTLSLEAEPPMEVQRAILYGYQGHRISLGFPIDSELVDNYAYLNWYKTIRVSSCADDFGTTWLHVDAVAKCSDELDEFDSSDLH